MTHDQLPGEPPAGTDVDSDVGGVSSLNLPPPASAGGGPFRVPSRRPSVTEAIYWPIDRGAAAALGVLGRKVFLTAGWDPSTGRVVEVFLRGGSKHGDRIDFALDELAIDLSRRLQAGAPLLQLLHTVALAELAEPLLPAPGAPRFPSVLVVEAVLHRLVQIECHLVDELARPR
jgi:hypothetical protein